MTIRYDSGRKKQPVFCMCEDQSSVDEKVTRMLENGEKNTEVILIPLLECVNLEKYLQTGQIRKVICGGDCGPLKRICEYDWILNLREQCVRNQVEFTFAQTGSTFKKDGKIYKISPENQGIQAKKAGIDFTIDYFEKIEGLFQRLGRSKFRSGFVLREKDWDYISLKGLDVIEEHAHDMIRKRLAPAVIPNDGKQTPMRGHPVFTAQHATATCCRGCLEKWHHIPAGKQLTEAEQNYIVEVIMEWIKRQIRR